MNNPVFDAMMDVGTLAAQFSMRMGLLTTLRAGSLARHAYSSYLNPVNLSSRQIRELMEDPSYDAAVGNGLRLMEECADRALWDWGDQVQSALLMQAEASVWAERIGKRLTLQ